jgi:hypothetical protein
LTTVRVAAQAPLLTVVIFRVRQRNRSLARQHAERECLLQVQQHGGAGVIEIADAEVLSNRELKVPAAHAHHDGAVRSGCPHNRAVYQLSNVIPSAIP